eukprot:TRINITY_DN101206_c0_g1_i1.p1 TRINITY_DN101206_c0_g1~~TRINITY_DN101206_c0_g1_i1.p1  ORF type:complete len:588 (+),score=76.56 TRINITY_DN101206_c0_g1_i1:675-2438(+)
MGEDDDVLRKARCIRGPAADHLAEQHREGLEKIRTFLRDHVAESAAEATHVVLENYPDWWWTGRKAPAGLRVEGEADVEQLYECIADSFRLGVPLTFAERRTPTFRLFQDVEAWGTEQDCFAGEELVGPQSALLQLLSSTLREVFPCSSEFLDVLLFDASGLSQTKGLRKTSIRLVWPGFVVDSDRAARVRDLLVQRLNLASQQEASDMFELQTRLQELSSSNAWHSVFPDIAYSGKSTVRLPLCDRVSPLPLRAAEGRPFRPLGVVRVTFKAGSIQKAAQGQRRQFAQPQAESQPHSSADLKSVEWLCKNSDLELPEWVKIGAIRQGDANARLTDWTMTSLEKAQALQQSTSRTGRVRIRTAGGSEAMAAGQRQGIRTNKNGAEERAGQLMTVERQLAGSTNIDDMVQKLQLHFGTPVDDVDGTKTWKQADDDSRIALDVAERRVKIVGRHNKVRSLVLLISPYTEAARPLMSNGENIIRKTSSQYPTPSAAFAPAVSADAKVAVSALPVSSAVSNCTSGQRRKIKHAFAAEEQGELSLALGAVVQILQDPDADDGNDLNRWVYGKNEAQEQCGWFPLSHCDAHVN